MTDTEINELDKVIKEGCRVVGIEHLSRFIIGAGYKRPQDNNIHKCKCNRHPDSAFTVIVKNDIPYCPRCGGIVWPKFGRDNSGMVLDEKEWRNLMIDIMCDAMGCTNWDFEPNENGDKFIKKWTEVFKQRFSQQPPKERKVSLEVIAYKIWQYLGHYYHGNGHNVKWEELNPKEAEEWLAPAKAILSLLNATEERERNKCS